MDEDDPLAVVSRLVELAGLAVSIWYLWTIIRQDPQYQITERRVRDWVKRKREREAFMRGSTIVDEAAYILATEEP